MDVINQLKPSSYEYRVGEFGTMALASGKHYGVIAQDLQQVLPDLVSKQKFVPVDKDEPPVDYLGVNYNELIPILIKGMQEQQKIIEELKARVAALEQQKVQ